MILPNTGLGLKKPTKESRAGTALRGKESLAIIPDTLSFLPGRVMILRKDSYTTQNFTKQP